MEVFKPIAVFLMILLASLQLVLARRPRPETVRTAASGDECTLFSSSPAFDQGTDIYQRSHFVTATADKVYVTDRYANKIYTYDHSGSKTGAIELTSPDTPFNQPSGLTPVGNSLFIADIKNNRIVETDLQGKFVSQFGTSGSGDGGQMDAPHDIAWSSKRPDFLYITDTENARMLIFKTDGTYIGKFSDGDEDPTTCAFDSNGYLYVTHKKLGEIFKHGFSSDASDPFPKSTTVKNIGAVKPKQLNIGPDDSIYVATSETDNGAYGAVRRYDNAMNSYCKIANMVPSDANELPSAEAYGVDIDPTNGFVWITDGPRDTNTNAGGHVFTYKCEGTTSECTGSSRSRNRIAGRPHGVHGQFGFRPRGQQRAHKSHRGSPFMKGPSGHNLDHRRHD